MVARANNEMIIYKPLSLTFMKWYTVDDRQTSWQGWTFQNVRGTLQSKQS